MKFNFAALFFVILSYISKFMNSFCRIKLFGATMVYGMPQACEIGTYLIKKMIAGLWVNDQISYNAI